MLTSAPLPVVGPRQHARELHLARRRPRPPVSVAAASTAVASSLASSASSMRTPASSSALHLRLEAVHRRLQPRLLAQHGLRLVGRVPEVRRRPSARRAPLSAASCRRCQRCPRRTSSRLCSFDTRSRRGPISMAAEDSTAAREVTIGRRRGRVDVARQRARPSSTKQLLGRFHRLGGAGDHQGVARTEGLVRGGIDDVCRARDRWRSPSRPVSPRRSSWRSVRPMTRESARQRETPARCPGPAARWATGWPSPACSAGDGAPSASSPLCAARCLEKDLGARPHVSLQLAGAPPERHHQQRQRQKQDRQPLEARQERLRDRHQRHAGDQEDRDLQVTSSARRGAAARSSVSLPLGAGKRLGRQRRGRARAPSAPRPARTETAAPASRRSAPPAPPRRRRPRRARPSARRPAPTAIRRSRWPPQRPYRGSADCARRRIRVQAVGARASTRSPCTQAP